MMSVVGARVNVQLSKVCPVSIAEALAVFSLIVDVIKAAMDKSERASVQSLLIVSS